MGPMDYRDHQKFGDARFASLADLEAGNFFDPAGVYLGVDPNTGRDIHWNRQGHIVTIAPPGLGKTAKVVMNNLLQYNRGSVVALDPKGTLTAVTADYRRSIGDNVVVLNPWHEEITEAYEVDLGETGYNPLRSLTPDNRSLNEDAETLAQILCPTPPNSRDEFFTKGGADVLAAVMIYLVHTTGRVTLPALYEFLSTHPKGWEQITKDMIEVGKGLEQRAAKIQNHLTALKQWAGVLAAAEAAVTIYNPEKALATHVSKDEFDPATLKQRPTTVYIVIPGNRRRANEAWLSLVLATLAESVGKPGPSFPVLMVAEEFANLGYMPTITTAMAEYREAGLQVHLIIQNLNQLFMQYGKDGGQSILRLCSVSQFLPINDEHIADMLSRMFGQYTVTETIADGINPERIHDKYAQQLARFDALMNMELHEQFITINGPTPPIYAHTRGYWEDTKTAPRAQHNPMRGEETPLPSPQVSHPLWITIARLPFDIYIALFTELYEVMSQGNAQGFTISISAIMIVVGFFIGSGPMAAYLLFGGCFLWLFALFVFPRSQSTSKPKGKFEKVDRVIRRRNDSGW